MPSFMTTFRTFWSGPLVKAELAHLRRHTATQPRWISRLALIIAGCIASIPLWIDMPDNPRSMVLFPIIILAVYAFQLNVSVKTLTLASHSIAREAQTENWDNLVLTGIDARKIVLVKWLAIMACIWRDYFWVATLKLGLILGLTHYLNEVFVGACYRHLASGLCYVNDYSYPYRYFYGNVMIPLCIFVLLLGLFSLAEAGLLAALGICFGSLSRRHRMVGMTCAAVFRGVLVFVAVVIWLLVGEHSRRLFEQTSYYVSIPSPAVERWNMSVQERQELLGSAQIVLSPLADSGTLLLTDLLRPIMLYDHFLQRIMTGGIALAVFGGLIWLSLRLAEMLAVRQHALRPREQERHTQQLAT